jgi:hypothetical protein
MAHVTPTGRPPPGPQWYAPSTTQPNQLIKDPAIQYQKQEEEYTQYTSISTTMTTASPTRYNSYDDLILDRRLDEITKRTEAQLKKLQDNFNETLREMYQAIKQLQSINDPDAQYQKQNENTRHMQQKHAVSRGQDS